MAINLEVKLHSGAVAIGKTCDAMSRSTTLSWMPAFPFTLDQTFKAMTLLFIHQDSPIKWQSFLKIAAVSQKSYKFSDWAKQRNLSQLNVTTNSVRVVSVGYKFNAAKLAIRKKASKQLLFKDDGKVRRYTYPVSRFCKKNKASLGAKESGQKQYWTFSTLLPAPTGFLRMQIWEIDGTVCL